MDLSIAGSHEIFGPTSTYHLDRAGQDHRVLQDPAIDHGILLSNFGSSRSQLRTNVSARREARRCQTPSES